MKEVTQKEFDEMVEDRARSEYNRALRLGRFVPIQFLREQARKKLLYEVKLLPSKPVQKKRQ